MVEMEALKLALSKEKEAVAVYGKLSIDHPNLKELFYFLMNEEEKHAAMIQRKIDELYK
jgi:rubrerythrin